jgi:hypothetical protein
MAPFHLPTALQRSIEMNDTIISLCCSLGVLLAASLGYKYIEPNGGQDVRIHLLYIAFAIGLVVFLPPHIAEYIFTELTVSFVGAMYPVYRATKAVCTPEGDDDKEWLQYWVRSF